MVVVFFFQAEDGIRDLVRSRGLGDVYKRQEDIVGKEVNAFGGGAGDDYAFKETVVFANGKDSNCLLYTSDAADERSSVDLGGRRIIKKKK